MLHFYYNITDVNSGSKQVLQAEDEPLVLTFLKRLLQSWGYRVFSARNGQEALEMAEAHNGEIDLLVSDVTMPEMEGPELAEWLTFKRPKLKVILLSGYSQAQIRLHRRWGFVRKPFRAEELKTAVEDCLK